MKIALTFASCILSLGVAATTTLAQAEPAPPPAQPEFPRETRIYAAKGLDLEEIIIVLRSVFNSHSVAAVERTNSIVVRGDKQTLDQIADLLDQLRGQAQAASEQTSEVIKLQLRDPRYIEEAVSRVHRSVRLEAVKNSNNLLIWGPATDVAKVRELIAELDSAGLAPPDHGGRPLLVTVSFIQASAGSNEQGTLPEHLEEIELALEGSGMGNLKLLGQLMARVKEAHEFSSEGFVELEGTHADGQRGQIAFIRVKGTAMLGRTGQADLEIAAQITAPISMRQGNENAEGKAKRVSSYEEFGFETSASVPLGDYVVLGAVPTRLEESDTVLTVLRVTTD